MARKKKEVYWELVRKYRESEDGPIYEDTQIHEVQDEITVDLKVRKYTETIEEVELISIDELNALAESLDNEYYIYP